MSEREFVKDPVTGARMSRDAAERLARERAQRADLEAKLAAGVEKVDAALRAWRDAPVAFKLCTTPGRPAIDLVSRADAADQPDGHLVSPAMAERITDEALMNRGSEGVMAVHQLLPPTTDTRMAINALLPPQSEVRDVPKLASAEPAVWREEVHAMLRAGYDPAKVISEWPGWELPDDVRVILDKWLAARTPVGRLEHPASRHSDGLSIPGRDVA